VGLDDWLALTQSWPVWARFGIAAATIAPLAAAMGHMFPTGLRSVRAAGGGLVPWAWAINGFASVSAAIATPLVAMAGGFSAVTLLAMGCYVLAAVLSRRLPGARAGAGASPSG
jgi:hypothetical protein